MSGFKHLFKQWIPPVILPMLKKLVPAKQDNNLFTGNYTTWKDALLHSEGYDQPSILEKVKCSALRVKKGDAVYERDSAVFNHIEYSWLLLSGLLLAASRNQNRLSVLDFGGSLGTTYFQNRSILSSLNHLDWNIVEQPHYVKCGKDFFEDDVLKFHVSFEECLQQSAPDVVILSSVLQYMEDPDALSAKIINSKINLIIIDKIIVHQHPGDRIMVQHVPDNIYKASYPVRFFNEEDLLSKFSRSFNVLLNYQYPREYNSPILDHDGRYIGYLLERKK